MQDVQLKLLQRCIRDLGILGCTFAIIDSDGQKHGTLEVVEPKKNRSQFEYGAVTSYVESFIKDMKIGDVVEIAVNEFGQHRLQSSIASWFIYRHGVGSQTSTFNKEKNILEVMRLQ